MSLPLARPDSRPFVFLYDLEGVTQIEIAFTKTKSRGALKITDYSEENFLWFVDGELAFLTVTLDNLLLEVRGKRNIPIYATVWIGMARGPAASAERAPETKVVATWLT